MAAGYTAFFIYTALIGVVAIVLSFLVAARQGDIGKATEPEEAV
jgi:PAT family beta-lactamase induction signal transducer AmpG